MCIINGENVSDDDEIIESANDSEECDSESEVEEENLENDDNSDADKWKFTEPGQDIPRKCHHF